MQGVNIFYLGAHDGNWSYSVIFVWYLHDALIGWFVMNVMNRCSRCKILNRAGGIGTCDQSFESLIWYAWLVKHINLF